MEQTESFYFVRHGETDWKLEGKFQGHSDVPLNASGKDQALAAAGIVAATGVNVIFCSHLARSMETATIFVERFLLKPRLEVVHDLSECESELTARLMQSGLGRSRLEVSTAGEVTPAAFIHRVERGLDRVFEERDPLVVAHGGTYWAICQLLGIPPKDIPNCMPIKFEKHGTNWSQGVVWN